MSSIDYFLKLRSVHECSVMCYYKQSVFTMNGSKFYYSPSVTPPLRSACLGWAEGGEHKVLRDDPEYYRHAIGNANRF
jgi:hypothetical protein